MRIGARYKSVCRSAALAGPTNELLMLKNVSNNKCAYNKGLNNKVEGLSLPLRPIAETHTKKKKGAVIPFQVRKSHEIFIATSW